MNRFRIVETDNFGGDYPNEQFLNIPPLHKEQAEKIAAAINNCFGPNHHRFWTVKPEEYELQPGFEP